MNARDQKIRLKTLMVWFLFRLKITSLQPVITNTPKGAVSTTQYKYTFTPRYWTTIIFFIIGIIPILFIGGIPAIKSSIDELFSKRTQGDQGYTEIKITKVFAYNRF